MRNETDENMLLFADEMYALPRKRLQYRASEELFDDRPELIYGCNE